MNTKSILDAGASPEATDDRPAKLEVVCTVCERDVPISEAVVPEATDYVVYLCGLDCYARWSSNGRH